jgi:hypothetical protein
MGEWQDAGRFLAWTRSTSSRRAPRCS